MGGGTSRNGVSGARGSPGCCPPVPASRPSSLSPAPAPGKQRGLSRHRKGKEKLLVYQRAALAPKCSRSQQRGVEAPSSVGKPLCPAPSRSTPVPRSFGVSQPLRSSIQGLRGSPEGSSSSGRGGQSAQPYPNSPQGCAQSPPPQTWLLMPPHLHIPQISGTRPHGRLWTHLNLSCPAVSQNCSLTRSPGSSSTN